MHLAGAPATLVEAPAQELVIEDALKTQPQIKELEAELEAGAQKPYAWLVNWARELVIEELEAELNRKTNAWLVNWIPDLHGENDRLKKLCEDLNNTGRVRSSIS